MVERERNERKNTLSSKEGERERGREGERSEDRVRGLAPPITIL